MSELVHRNYKITPRQDDLVEACARNRTCSQAQVIREAIELYAAMTKRGKKSLSDIISEREKQ